MNTYADRLATSVTRLNTYAHRLPANFAGLRCDSEAHLLEAHLQNVQRGW